jgi:small-conductance mechanosensitive channel
MFQLAFRLIFAAFLLIAGLTASWAQDNATPDYESWRSVASRATEAVEAGRASDVALEELRGQLVDWRQIFEDAQTTNENAIETVQDQLDALGPEPEEGPEPEDISLQRSELTSRLAQLQVPVRTAQVAFTEADGLIRGVDTILRSRQADELLDLGPTPLNPVLWPEGLEALRSSLVNTMNEVLAAWAIPLQREELRKNLPQVLFLTVLALLLLARGRYWVERLALSIQTRGATLRRWLAASIISLGQVALPYAGLIALIEAAYATELAGLRGELILSTLPKAGFAILASFWLGSRVFPVKDDIMPFIRLNDEQRREGRIHALSLGGILALNYVLEELARYDTWSDGAIAAIYLPIFALASLFMWRLAILLGHHDRAGAEPNYADRLIGVLGRLIMAAAVLTVTLAAIGYFSAAHRLLVPTLTTMQILALVLVLQRVISVAVTVVTGGSSTSGDSLIPVFLGFVLVIASLPFLALVWGARDSDLAELWDQITRGLVIGETRISPTDFFTFIIVFLAGFLVTRLLQGAMKNTVLPRTRIDIGGQKAVVSGIGYVGIFLAGLIAITTAGIDLSSIALVAGALSVGIGFGLQNVVSNFVSGIILLIERPISEGDWIEVNGSMGYVRSISVRSTRIETFDRTDVIVPNADLVSGTVTNYTRGNTIGRVIVPVGVAYGTDPRRVEAILLEIARSHPMVLENPAPSVVFQGFGASSLDFEIRAILRDVNWVLSVRSEMNYMIAERFTAEDIEIPFAQTDLWLRNPEALRAAAKPSNAPEDENPT